MLSGSIYLSQGDFRAVGLGAIAGGAFGGIPAIGIGFVPSMVACALIVGASGIILRTKVRTGKGFGPVNEIA